MLQADVATGRLLHAVGDGGTAYDFAAVQIVGPRMAYADNALEFFPQFLLPPLLACGDVDYIFSYATPGSPGESDKVVLQVGFTSVEAARKSFNLTGVSFRFKFHNRPRTMQLKVFARSFSPGSWREFPNDTPARKRKLGHKSMKTWRRDGSDTKGVPISIDPTIPPWPINFAIPPFTLFPGVLFDDFTYPGMYDEKIQSYVWRNLPTLPDYPPTSSLQQPSKTKSDPSHAQPPPHASTSRAPVDDRARRSNTPATVARVPGSSARPLVGSRTSLIPTPSQPVPHLTPPAQDQGLSRAFAANAPPSRPYSTRPGQDRPSSVAPGLSASINLSDLSLSVSALPPPRMYIRARKGAEPEQRSPTPPLPPVAVAPPSIPQPPLYSSIAATISSSSPAAPAPAQHVAAPAPTYPKKPYMAHDRQWNRDAFLLVPNQYSKLCQTRISKYDTYLGWNTLPPYNHLTGACADRQTLAHLHSKNQDTLLAGPFDFAAPQAERPDGIKYLLALTSFKTLEALDLAVHRPSEMLQGEAAWAEVERLQGEAASQNMSHNNAGYIQCMNRLELAKEAFERLQPDMERAIRLYQSHSFLSIPFDQPRHSTAIAEALHRRRVLRAWTHKQNRGGGGKRGAQPLSKTGWGPDYDPFLDEDQGEDAYTLDQYEQFRMGGEVSVRQLSDSKVLLTPGRTGYEEFLGDDGDDDDMIGVTGYDLGDGLGIRRR